jgi:DDE superfamily endonuclease
MPIDLRCNQWSSDKRIWVHRCYNKKTCHPIYNQKQAYSGHKRHHGMKFQSVTGPEGFSMSFNGPVTGCRHDSFMVYESGLLSELQRLLPNADFSIFRDPAYPNSPWLWGDF